MVNSNKRSIGISSSSSSSNGSSLLNSVEEGLHHDNDSNRNRNRNISNGNGNGNDNDGIRNRRTWRNNRNRNARQSCRPRRRNSCIQRHGSQVCLPRLVNRDMPFDQSTNRMAVVNINAKLLWNLAIKDWFHLLLRVPTALAVFVLISIWTLAILLFAGLYMMVDGINIAVDCGLGESGTVIPFAGAFAFAMETATTVGYGLPGDSNAFFEDGCSQVQITIYFQMVFNMMFNAFMFAFFFSQLSKSETRSIQLVYSNKLVIGVKDNKVYASVRCYDLDSSYPLVEAHARMYLLDHKLKMKPLRLVDPDDDHGGMMHPSIPQEIVHEIDHHSALSPRGMPLVIPEQQQISISSLSSTKTKTNTNTKRGRKSGICLPLRSIDSVTGGREEIACPVCGDTFSTYELLKTHADWNKLVEEQENYPIESSHRSFVMPDITPISLSEVQNHIERTMSEIVVVVEAIDPQLSGTFQSLQSYKYENIEFGADFEHCMTVDTLNNKIAVDMQKFHMIKNDENYADCCEDDDDDDDDSCCDDDDDDDNDSGGGDGGNDTGELFDSTTSASACGSHSGETNAKILEEKD